MEEVLIGGLLVALGFWLGGRREKPRGPRAELPPVEEAELRRLREDKAAFGELMGYNAQRAYGKE